MPSQKSGHNNSLFWYMNYLGYGAPWGFGWDINGGKATPLIEDENNEDYNLKERAEVYAVMMHGW